MILLAALLIVAAAMTHTTEAQDRSPTAAAEDVVRTAFAELDAMRWSGAAALVHPQTLEHFRAWKLRSARAKERLRNEPPEYRRDPDMPPEVVAWLEEQRKEQEEQRKRLGPELSHQFAGVETLEQVEALSAEELFARYLQTNDPREQRLRGMRAEGKEIPPEAVEAMPGPMLPRRAVIGSTLEDDSTVHVIYRTQFHGHPERDAGGNAVVTVRRTPQGWRLWTGSQDRTLFATDLADWSAASFVIDADEPEHLLKLAETVITWPLEGGGEGRAFMTGYTGGDEPPKALVIEIVRPDGTKLRAEIPAESFPRVAELLHGWPKTHEPQ